jgi:NodT family efflux transporter outer membrane factor (OMF) lipoprotein
MIKPLLASKKAPVRCTRLMLRRAYVGLAAIILLVGGCASTSPRSWFHNGFKVGPNYCRPPAPVAEQWIGAEDPRVEQGPPRDGDWWSVFQDPTLNSLIARAYQQNPDLRAVGTRVLQARAQQAIAAGGIFPQSQQLSGLYPQGEFAGISNHINVTTFNLAWEVDFWGKYRRQIESANAGLDSSVENYDDALVTLFADVASNYVQYRIAQQRIRIAQANLQTQQRLVTLSVEQQRVGTAIELDGFQLRTLMAQTAASIPALEIVRGLANDRLSILLGEPPHDLEPELGSGPELGGLTMPALPTSVAVGIPADLLRRRPDIRSAERLVAAQSALIGVAEAELYPSLSVSALLGHADLNLAPINSTGGVSLVVPQFSWKILNYGRLLNNVRLQEARTQELVAAYQSRVLAAAQEAQTALRAFLRSQEQAEHLSASAGAATSATRIGEQLFTEVKADVNRLFTLESSKLQVQDQFAVAQGNVALSLIDIYRALGGGWEIRLSDNGHGVVWTGDLPRADGVPAAPGAEPIPMPKVQPDQP